MRTECLLYWKDCCVVCLSIKYSKYLHSVLFGRPPPRSLTDPSPPVPPCSPCFSSLLHLLALFPTDLHPLVYSLFVQVSYSRLIRSRCPDLISSLEADPARLVYRRSTSQNITDPYKDPSHPKQPSIATHIWVLKCWTRFQPRR